MRILGFNIGFNITKNGKRAPARSVARSYDAADKGRRGKPFRFAGSTGPNAEIFPSLQDLRNRSRHMVRNNGWAKRAVEAVVKHTVGEGIRPAPLGKSSQENQFVKSVWRRWAETTACDWEGKTNLYGLQELAMRAIVEGGDAIVLLRRVTEGDVPIKIQLCEGDVIDHTRNGVIEGGIARFGVQFSMTGELVGYWLFPYHPGDGYVFALNNQSTLFDKKDVLHVYELLRIGQVRGVPFGVSAFMKLSDFCDYEDAQLTKQKVAASFCAFVTNEAGDDLSDKKEKKPLEQLEPGIIERLRTGEQITFAGRL